MTRDEQYRTLLIGLLPPGAALSKEPDSALGKLMHGLAGEMARAHERTLALPEEADPRTTLELLPDWERVAGLPDPCTAPANTIQERRAALVQRLTSRGGQSIAYFLSVAAQLGYVGVTIEEFRPFVCGHSHCGDPLSGAPSVRFYWRVRVPDPRVTWFRTGVSQCGDRLGEIDRAEDLECMFERLKPAHTDVIFAYEGA